MTKSWIKTLQPNTPAKALGYVFLAALAFRLWGITHPLLDFHSWRQTLTATIAKNFYAGDMNLFHPSTHFVNENYEFEFPLYTFLVALLYKVFGFHDALGRAVSVVFALGSLGVLYRLVKRYYDETAAVIACGFFAVLPMAVYYTRTFMPESAMLFFSLSMVYGFTRWLDTDRWRYFFLAAGSAALAFLVKLPTLYMGGPLLFLALLKFRSRIFFQYKLYLFVLIALLPPWLWYSHMSDLAARQAGETGLWLTNDKLANWETLTDYRFYKLVFGTRVVEKMFAFTAFPFLVLGMASRPARKEQYVFHVWIASVCAYFLIVAVGNRVHEYYQLPIIPVGVVFVGKFLSDFFKRRWGRGRLQRDALAWVVIVMIVFIPIHSVYKLTHRLGYNLEYVDLGQKVQEITQENERILLQDGGGDRPQFFYFSDRKGWSLGLEPSLTPETLQSYKAQGADYYGMIRADLKEANPSLYRYLKNTHQPVIEEPRITLFKLNP